MKTETGANKRNKKTKHAAPPPVEETVAENTQPETTNGSGGNGFDAQPETVSPSISPIQKPGNFNLDKFRSKRAPTVANVATLQSALAVHNMAAAKDFVRLHPDEEAYWSPEFCFVHVPIVGQKHDHLHLIDEELAEQYLDGGKILRFRLALATKPHDVFFLCHVPSQRLDNRWNSTNLDGCEQAKSRWTRLTSRKDQGYEEYKVSFARDEDAFPEPNWPTQSLGELIGVTFKGRMIDHENHEGLLRLTGAKVPLNK
jgi:hypothetical protein